MTGRCSCGATLVEDALFCHRCGKPQREDLILRDETLDPQPAAAPEILQTEPPPVGFNNRRAARASLLSAFISFLLMSALAGLVGGAAVVVLILAGFLAVYFYRRGAPVGEDALSARIGARMGWMTGVFAFLLVFVQFTLTVVLSDVPVRDLFLKPLEQQAAANPQLQDAMAILNSPQGVGMFLAMIIIVLFITCTLLTTLGGALGAQFGPKTDEK